jgi:hypothetical protein
VSEQANVAGEPRLLSLIATDLRSRGWEVQANRVIGLYQVDLLVTAPNKNALAVELKVFPGSVGFGTLNNVAALRGGLAAFGELSATPVLLAVATATPSLHELAERLGVSFAVASPADDENTVRTYFVEHLIRAASMRQGASQPAAASLRQPTLLEETAAQQLAERVALVEAPQAGLYRAGRWIDVSTYPPAPRPTSLHATEPMLYGSRWSDPLGKFSTVSLSITPEAAVGQYLARFRRATTAEGTGIVDAILAFLKGPPDPGEPELVVGAVPAAVFDDLCLLRVHFEGRPPLLVDLESPATRAALAEYRDRLGAPVGGAPDDVDLARTVDRRLTWLAIRALYEACAARSVGPAAGIIYRDPMSPHWASVVAWSPPALISLDDEAMEVRALAPADLAVQRSAEQLDLLLP